MAEYHSFAAAYKGGLQSLLADGEAVPSVCDSFSKASDFGKRDRPSRELIAHTFRVRNPQESLALSPALPVNLPYCFGLLAWSLDGRNDVGTPAYYRRGAYEFSDDQHTLSGAFGHRLFSSAAGGDQLEAIIGRIRNDPAHRRTFGLILDPSDNFRRSREYPCGVGVQLFLRDGKLTWLTMMRAQQALTVLPYDTFLFMLMHQFAASLLDVPCGTYIHQSGTFHFYENEIELASRVITEPMTSAYLPALPETAEEARAAVDEMIVLEGTLREAAIAGDVAAVDRIASDRATTDFNEVVRSCLATFAYCKLGEELTHVETSVASAEVSAVIAGLRAEPLHHESKRLIAG